MDLEAIGLVLLAAGASLLGLLIPGLPTGTLGTVVQDALLGNLGFSAYAIPIPMILLGGAFLVRQNPRGWPRMLIGYLLTGLGVWSVAMLTVPAQAGALGLELRAVLGDVMGVTLVIPAVILVTLGLDVLFGFRPTRIVRGTLLALGSALARTWRFASATRRQVKARAAFRADVALVRGEVQSVARDLNALAGLYPGSGELVRWRDQVVALRQRLRGVDEAGLEEARADVTTWRAAVDDFTAARAVDLVGHLRSEGVRDFTPWLDARSRDLESPMVGPAKSSAALDEIRKALALDVTALDARYRKLTRERDQAEAALADVDARGLVQASEAHAARRAAYREVADTAETLEATVEHLDGWRVLVDELNELVATFPGVEDVTSFDASLARELHQRGREALAEPIAWRDALADVQARAASLAFDGPQEVDEAADGGDAEQPAPVHASDLADAPAGEDDGPPFDATRDAATPPPPSVPGTARDSEHVPDVGGIPVQLPPIDLLNPLPPRGDDPEARRREAQDRVERIDATLANFNLQGRVVSSVRGPTVTRFELEPAPGEKISRFANLSDDLALAMAASSVRIEAPIPGKSVIGLEVPNADRDLIRFREAVTSSSFQRARARLPLILGKSIDGEMTVGDLAKMPHMLIAGSTGSGKSVAVNTFIASLIYRFLPTELRFLMIDPKMVELTPFDGVPHLIRPVVTNPADAAGVLLGAVTHMERRYKMMSRIGAKNLDQYNEKARNLDLPQLPFIVIVIDELADLMITSPKEVESAIMRLAQMARATGMHLILATQRPSVDIITSLIKVNVPARVAFAVSSSHDSRTILDSMGAERLVGNGDMLFHQPGLTKPVRLQGPYVSEDEMATVASFLRRQYFDDEFVEAYGADFEPVSADDSEASGLIDWNDDKLRVAAELVINEGNASVSRLQRRLQVGHARAGKLMDSLEALGVVGPHVGSKPREVLVDLTELPNIFGS